MKTALGLGFSSTKSINTYTGISLITNYTGEINATLAGTNNGRSDVMAQHRALHRVGRADVSELYMALCGYMIPSNGGTVKPLGNSYINRSCIQQTVSVPIYFDGQRDRLVNSGDNMVLSDAIPMTLAAGSDFYHRSSNTIAQTSHVFPCVVNNTVGEMWVSPVVPSQIDSVSAMLKPSGGISGALNTPLLVGKFATPQPSVLFVGDSIAAGSSDTNRLGFLARGLDAGVGGHIIPWHRQAMNSWNYTSAVLSPQIQDAWKYATHLIFELGTNDIATGRSLAQVKADAMAMWVAARSVVGPYGKRPRIYQTLLLPRVASTDNCATLLNQTPINGFATGGVRDQFNAWVMAGGDGLLDGYIDVASVVEDPANHGKWLCNGAAGYASSDGVHPSVAFHALMGNAVNLWAQSLQAV